MSNIYFINRHSENNVNDLENWNEENSVLLK